MSNRPPGSNLPDFRAVQIDFAAHIREPNEYPAPEGIEARRLAIYVNLFYNNIESFLANAFPVAKQLLSAGHHTLVVWQDLVRAFVHTHPSESPYFMEIPQEFLEFVSSQQQYELPAWLLELLHYEWVEMALAVDEREIPTSGFDPEAELRGRVLLSPLIWPLSYEYAVHEIGPDRLPQAKPRQPTHLIVYRRADDKVKFVRSNALTHRLLALLGDNLTAEDAFASLAAEAGLEPATVAEQGGLALSRLVDAGIVLGAATD